MCFLCVRLRVCVSLYVSVFLCVCLCLAFIVLEISVPVTMRLCVCVRVCADMLDLGWLRSGSYLYRTCNLKTCCPNLPIRSVCVCVFACVCVGMGCVRLVLCVLRLCMCG